MLIGPRGAAVTSVSTADEQSVTVRGFDLCRDLIGRLGFTDYFILLLMGQRPSEVQRHVVDAVLVALAEHGLTPSVQASRMTLASGPEAWQGAVAAGILGVGSVILGSSERSGKFLAEGIAEAQRTGASFQATAEALVRRTRERKEPLPGFGHPLHQPEDPRAVRLLQLADELGVAAAHVTCLRATAAAADAIYTRHLPINATGAIAAIMLDTGFPLDALKAIPILARTAGILAHLHEEVGRPIGFLLAHHASEAIAYDGAQAAAERS